MGRELSMTSENLTQDQGLTDQDPCPNCGAHMLQRIEVDIGVGIQYGPWGCYQCGWSEDSTDPFEGFVDE